MGSIVENNASFTHASLGAQVVCFCAGTLIATSNRAKAVAKLSAVETKGHGLQPICWIGHRTVSFRRSEYADDTFRPIRITAGALGLGLLDRDLSASRQHRMLVSPAISTRMLGQPEVLISAVKLTELPGVFPDSDIGSVEDFHVLIDRHEIIFAEGAPTESHFAGPESLKAVPYEARTEILSLYPELKDMDYTLEPVCVIPTGKIQKKLIARHAKNRKEVLERFAQQRGWRSENWYGL